MQENFIHKIQEAKIEQVEPGKAAMNLITISNFRLVPVSIPKNLEKITVQFKKNSCQTLQMFFCDSEDLKYNSQAKYEYGVELDLTGALHDFAGDRLMVPGDSKVGVSHDLSSRMRSFLGDFEVKNLYLNVLCPYWDSDKGNDLGVEMEFSVVGGKEPEPNSGNMIIIYFLEILCC